MVPAGAQVAAQTTVPLPQTAQAPSSTQREPQTPVAPVDPVTVSATRTERNLFDVPGSTSSVTRQTVDQRQPQKLDDLLRDLPGVEISGGPRPGAGQPNVRGLEGERVLIRLDGARQDFQAGHKGRLFIDPDLIKQIDVVRGPNSALYGSGALGGVLAITTRDASDFLRPGEKGGFRVKTAYQSVNDMFLGQAVGFFNTGGFDVLGAVTYRGANNYRFGGPGRLQGSGMDAISGLFKGGYTFQPGQRLGMTVMAFDDRDVSTSAPNTAGLPPDSVPVNRTTQQFTGVVNYEHRDPDLPWLDLKASVYHNRVSIEERRIGVPRLDETLQIASGADVQNTSRFQLSDSVKVAITYGVDGRFERTDGERNNVPRPQFPDGRGRVFGAFMQPEFRIWDTVTITPGVRYDHYYRAPASSTLAPALSEGRLSPRLGAQWDVAKWISLYAFYAEAFRAPSLGELYVSGVHFPGNNFIPNPNLRPETAKGKEIGVNFKFNDVVQSGDKLRLRLSGFHTNYRNFIEEIVTAVTSTEVNLPRARIYGTELEGGYVSGDWFGTLGASIIRGKDLTTNQPIASIPGDKLALTIGHQFPNWDVVIGARAKFIAPQHRVPTGVSRTGGYALFDVFATWQPSSGPLQGARFDLAVDNLTDRRYRDHLTPNLDPGLNFKAAASFQF